MSNSTENDNQGTAVANPRRPPAHRSVSLKHKQSAASNVARHGSQPPPQSSEPNASSASPSSLKPLVGKDDSGESSNAEKWFEKSNNNASRASPSFVDNSPPFFLQNSSSEETYSDPNKLRQAMQNGNGTATASMTIPNLLNFAADNSSTEDFRSVIDDLTIENKKLKRKLKSYQKLQDSHLKDQKLFEVRVHGLPTSKKKELEEMLRRFAMGLHGAPGASDLQFPAGLPNAQSGSSSATNPFADSAYQSLSASGQGSSARSSSDTRKKQPDYPANSARSRHRNVQNYLHDIPEGLMARRPTAMTEKTKKKLIVRRLEQIFAGKGAVAGGNQQPQQQEEVSQSAAKADRELFYETQGQNAPREGIREARIMTDTSTSKDFAGVESVKDKPKGGVNAIEVEQGKVNIQSPLEQRPTRPLDLDPYRAQVPSDNIKYITHLGFSPPWTQSSAAPADGHGWIYLNLLSNMAQLHTINVTPEFVRAAVADHSKKFELSSDGRKIRWKGGSSITKHSSDGDSTPSAGSALNNLSSDRGSPRKRLKMSQSDSVSGSKPSRSEVDRTENKLAWTPLFYHRSNEDDTDVSSSADEEETNESAFPFPTAGDSSGMTSSGIKTASGRKLVKKETGPIIFYNNAKFCTDLSGDAKAEEAMMYNAYLYHSVAQQALGVTGQQSPTDENIEGRSRLDTFKDLPDEMELDKDSVSPEHEVHFPEQTPLTPQVAKHRKAIKFDVSGLGGVYPADNFTINVESAHAQLDDEAAPETGDHALPSRYPDGITKALTDFQSIVGHKARTAFHKRVINTRHEELRPSELPDASCFINAGDTTPEDYDDEDMDDDAMSIAPASMCSSTPSAAPQPIQNEYASDVSEEGDDEDDTVSDDGSLDLLAAARALDPEAIRLQEREYDAQLAERLAEEIPAGSSAATAGGGSGWASPASGVDRAEWEAARKAAKEARDARKEKAKEDKAKEGLKRRRSEVDV